MQGMRKAISRLFYRSVYRYCSLRIRLLGSIFAHFQAVVHLFLMILLRHNRHNSGDIVSEKNDCIVGFEPILRKIGLSRVGNSPVAMDRGSGWRGVGGWVGQSGLS